MVRNDLDSVRSLLQVLRPGELESVKTYLKSFHQMYGDYEPKTLQLLRIVESNPRLGDAMVKAKVSPKASDNTFRMLITRLKEKMFEVLTLDINVGRTEAYSNAYRAKVLARKKMTQAEILHARGAVDEAIYLYNTVIKQCEKYEHFQQQVEALQQLHELKSFLFPHQNHQALLTKVEQCRLKEDAIKEARTQFYRLAALEETTAYWPNLLHDYQKTLAQLQQIESTRSSQRLRYWNGLIQLNQLEASKQSRAALEQCANMHQLLKESPAVFMDRRMGSVQLHLAHNALLLGNYEQTIRAATRARAVFEEESFNYLLALEYEFYGLFFTQQWQDAELLINNLVKRTDPRTSPFKHAKRQYFKACVLMMAGKHRRAHFILRDTVLLDKDRGGWNVNVRIANIMNQLQWGGLNRPTEAFVDNLYSLLNDLQRNGEADPRAVAILRMLRRLIANSFDFPRTAKEEHQLLTRLQTSKGPLRWRKPAPELIRFDAWFLARCEEAALKTIQISVPGNTR